MKDLTLAGIAKLVAALVMMAGWFYIRVTHTQGADDIVEFCKMGLTGLATHYLTYADPAADDKAKTGETTITIPGVKQ